MHTQCKEVRRTTEMHKHSGERGGEEFKEDMLARIQRLREQMMSVYWY